MRGHNRLQGGATRIVCVVRGGLIVVTCRSVFVRLVSVCMVASKGLADAVVRCQDEGSGRYVVEISGLGRKKTVEAELGVSLNLGEVRL